MSRQGSKTYGKQIFKETVASRAFDSIFSTKCIKPSAAKAQVHRWGKTSFTSKRDTQPVVENSTNGNSTDFVDPFSFDSEESPTKRKRRKYVRVCGSQSSQETTQSSDTPVKVESSPVSSDVSQWPPKTKLTARNSTAYRRQTKVVNARVPSPLKSASTSTNTEDIKPASPVMLQPTRTYSRTPKSSPKVTVSMPTLKQEFIESNINDLTPTDDLQQLKPDFTDIDDKSDMPVLEPFTKMSYKHSAMVRRSLRSPKKKTFEDCVSFFNDTPVSMDENVPNEASGSSGQSTVRNRYKTRTRPSADSITTIWVQPPESWRSGDKKTVKSEKDSTEMMEESPEKISDEDAKMRKMQREIDELLADEDIESPPKQSSSKVRKFFRSRPRDKKHFESNSGKLDSESPIPNTQTDSEKGSQSLTSVGELDSQSSSQDKTVSIDDVATEESENIDISGDSQDQNNADCVEGSKNCESRDSKTETPPDGEDSLREHSPTDAFDSQITDNSERDDTSTIVISSQLSNNSSNSSQEISNPPSLMQKYIGTNNSSSRTYTRTPKTNSVDDNKIFKSKNGTELKVTPTGIPSDLSSKRIFSSPKKLVAYNVRTWAEDSDDVVKQKSNVTKQESSDGISLFSDFDESEQPEHKQLLKRSVQWAKKAGDDTITSLHVKRQHKELFTVIQNVKQAYECQESGETQEFTDDIEYLLSSLSDTEPVSARCLSCLSFCTKCLLPAFRMHLRAHAIYTTIFSALHDAYSYPTLSLTTSLLLLMMSRDHINNELDTDILTIMLKLLGVTSKGDNTPSKMTPLGAKEYNRTLEKVREILQKLEANVKNKHFDYDNITAGNLVMEALLSLTAKRSGVLFKEELRETGALDHISDTVCECVDMIQKENHAEFTDNCLESLRKIERCLRVLDNATLCNPENQAYLAFYQKDKLISALSRILMICSEVIPNYPINTTNGKVNKDSQGWLVFTCILSVLRVLLNVTHDNTLAGTAVGKQIGLLPSALTCVVSLPHFVDCSEQFDLLVLSLGLLVNITEHCEDNRRVLFTSTTTVLYKSHLKEAETKPSINALIELFQQRDEAARIIEESGELVPKVVANATAQAIAGPSTSQGTGGDSQGGVWKESKSGLEWVVIADEDLGEDGDVGLIDQSGCQDLQVLGSQEEEDDFTKALHRAGRHMEDSIVAAYVSILIGYLIQGNMEYIELVKEKLPEEDFTPMIKILNKFYSFVTLTSAISTAANKSLVRVIEILESCNY